MTTKWVLLRRPLLQSNTRALNHGRERKYYGMRFDRGSQNFGFHMIAQSQLIADDRRRSQEIEHGFIFCDRDRRITDDRRSVFPYDRTIAIDRRRSQTIAGDRTWFYLLRSSAIAIAGSQTIAEVCFHMIANDHRLIAICDLRCAIIWKAAFRSQSYALVIIGRSSVDSTPIGRVWIFFSWVYLYHWLYIYQMNIIIIFNLYSACTVCIDWIGYSLGVNYM